MLSSRRAGCWLAAAGPAPEPARVRLLPQSRRPKRPALGEGPCHSGSKVVEPVRTSRIEERIDLRILPALYSAKEEMPKVNVNGRFLTFFVVKIFKESPLVRYLSSTSSSRSVQPAMPRPWQRRE